jgi:hypothetical protein
MALTNKSSLDGVVQQGDTTRADEQMDNVGHSSKGGLKMKRIILAIAALLVAAPAHADTIFITETAAVLVDESIVAVLPFEATISVSPPHRVRFHLFDTVPLFPVPPPGANVQAQFGMKISDAGTVGAKLRRGRGRVVWLRPAAAVSAGSGHGRLQPQ